MQVDKFTKTILVVIAIFLGIIALKPILAVQPAQAYTDSHVKSLGFAGNSSSLLMLLDTRSGTVWAYDLSNGDVMKDWSGWQLEELGSPLVK